MDVLACKRRHRGKLAAIDVEDTLVLILERIDSPVSLIRAASTCRRWRHVIADAGFLRRWRSVHGPSVAGDYYNRSPRRAAADSPLFTPLSSIDARHFSLDFVVDVSIFEFRSWDSYLSWQVRDSRGSLLLMECLHEPYMNAGFPDLVVCEPLTRRYKIIPRPPDFSGYKQIFRDSYLVDGDEDQAHGGRIGISNFRVLCLVLGCEDGLARTSLFTVGSADTDSMWSEMAIDDIALRLADLNVIRSCYLGRALGSSYHYDQEDRMLITHDGSTGKFSLSALSLDVKNYWGANNQTQKFSIVDGGDGEPRIVNITHHHTLKVFARVDGQWRLENKVMLSKVTCGLPGYRSSFLTNL